MSKPPIPTPAEILGDPSASNWIKSALQSALDRDPVDAANDAAILAEVLEKNVDGKLKAS
jgi:hypothetical protein